MGYQYLMYEKIALKYFRITFLRGYGGPIL